VRVAVAGVWHETNTFANTRTTLADFQRYEWVEGDAVISQFASTRTSIGGYIDGAANTGLELVPVFFAGALPSGLVTADAYADIERRLLTGLRAALPVDGLLAPLHGAMVAEGVDDVEGRLLSQMRTIVGPVCPVVATLDLHANISPRMVESAAVLIGYDTYPHVDIYDRGVEACQVMRALLSGDLVPSVAFEKPAILSAPQGQYTDREPMRGLLALAHAMEQEPDVVTITVAAGYPYSDIDRIGMSIVVTTNANPDLARDKARMLCNYAWENRYRFLVQPVPVSEAVKRAIAAPKGPVILVDSADNIGGGSPGDGTVALAELLKQGARGAVVVIADPEAVAQAIASGVGSQVRLRVGGKTDALHGSPVDVEGRVRLISDGRFTNKGPYMTGREVNMGRTVVLEVGGVTLVLTEIKTMPFDAEHLKSIAIDPANQHIIVVKSAIAWRAAYGDVAAEVIEMDTPGLCASDLRRFYYTRLNRALFPLSGGFSDDNGV
jgi:microcystin degradation protein MlrC